MNAITTNDLGDACITFANDLQRPFWYFEQNAHYYLLNPLIDPTLRTIQGIAKRTFCGSLNLVGVTLTLPIALLAFFIKGVGNCVHGQRIYILERKRS